MPQPQLPAGPLRDLCAALDDARRATRLTHAQLGARAGVSENTVVRACQCGRVRLETWVSLWTVLRVEILQAQHHPES